MATAADSHCTDTACRQYSSAITPFRAMGRPRPSAPPTSRPTYVTEQTASFIYSLITQSLKTEQAEQMISVLVIAALPVWANAAGDHRAQGAVNVTSAQASSVST